MAKKDEKLTAAALRYDPERDEVPVLAAYGEGLVAERIIETAQEHGIPVTEDAGLAAVLSKITVGDYIPPQLYEVVAKLLIFVAQSDREYGEKIRNKNKN